MAAPSIGLENSREVLAQAILNELQTWPEPHRSIFTQVHYQSRNIPDVAHSQGLDVLRVNEILAECEIKLRAAISVYRSMQGDSPPHCGQHFSPLLIVS